MYDIVEWMMAAFLASCAVLFLGFAAFLGGAFYVAAECYRSADPDSIACYMHNGKTSRIKADVNVK